MSTNNIANNRVNALQMNRVFYRFRHDQLIRRFANPGLKIDMMNQWQNPDVFPKLNSAKRANFLLMD